MKTKILIITIALLLTTINISTTTYAKYTIQKRIKLGNYAFHDEKQ